LNLPAEGRNAKPAPPVVLKAGPGQMGQFPGRVECGAGRLTCDSTGSCDLRGLEIIVVSGFLCALYCGRFFGSFLRPRERATIAIDVSYLFHVHN
jgi:hypothetical protein